jgi:hypothetical protein
MRTPSQSSKAGIAVWTPFVAALVVSAALAAGSEQAGARPESPTAPVATKAGKVLLSLPKPGGRYPVGVRSGSVSDPSRIDETTGKPRRLPIRVWYAARRHTARRSAPYLSPRVQRLFEQALRLPPGLFTIDTHAVTNAPARHDVRGVILAQPGGGSLIAFQTGQIVDLASRGYTVVAMDHPHDALGVVEADGTVIPEDDDSGARPLEERVLDAAVVLANLRRLVPQGPRDTPVAMFGHSRGAAATPEVMHRYPRVRAGVGLDVGSVLFGQDPPDVTNAPGEVVAAGLDRPFGLMCSLDVPCDLPVLVDFMSRLRGPHPIQQLKILHIDYTDFVVFNAEAARTAPGVARILERVAPSATVRDLPAGRRALADQRRFLARFMGRYLDKE